MFALCIPKLHLFVSILNLVTITVQLKGKYNKIHTIHTRRLQTFFKGRCYILLCQSTMFNSLNLITTDVTASGFSAA